MSKSIIVAIDGYAASGKSTTAKFAAEKTNFLYLDTGAMYRAVTLFVLRKKISLEDEFTISELAENLEIHFTKVDGKHRVFCSDEDVTDAIRSQKVTMAVSAVSAIKGVREKMVAEQRNIASYQNTILEGRDIGTVVFPDAPIKFWITASVEARAKRRSLDFQESSDFSKIKSDLKTRDEKDSSREHSPMKKADDAIVLDTTNLTIQEQVDIVCQNILEKQKEENERSLNRMNEEEEKEAGEETAEIRVTKVAKEEMEADKDIDETTESETVVSEMEEKAIETISKVIDVPAGDIPEEDKDIDETTESETVVSEMEEKAIETISKVIDVPAGDISEEDEDFEIQEFSESELKNHGDTKIINKELEDLYEQTFSNVQEKRCVTGTVVAVTDKEVSVDIGGKSEGMVSIDEFDKNALPLPGDKVEVFLKQLENRKGHPELSKREADIFHAWEKLATISENDEIVEGTIQRRVKGGFVVDVEGLDCFLPGSQVDVRPVINFDEYIDKLMDFKIVKINRERRNIVVSHKILLMEELHDKREELISQMQIGMVLEGHVKNITEFGVFVDLGGIDGLLHITDMSWGRINHPSEIVKRDDVIQVKVIDFDREKQRVSLGIKQMKSHPWENIDDRLNEGDIINGKVVSITNYGAFIELEPGIEGLVHISEISWTQHIKHPNEVFNIDELFETKILSIDIEARKISLGIKQLTPDPWDKVVEKYAQETVHNAIVRTVTQYGIFCELEKSIEGMVHISDMSWTRKIYHPKELVKKGDEIKVKILSLTPEQRKISLGIKQVEENPWPELSKKYGVGTSVECTVFKVLERSLIVELEDGVMGLVPILRKQGEQRQEEMSRHEIGAKLSLIVIDFNKEKQFIKLSNSTLMVTREDKKIAEEEIALATINQGVKPEGLDIPDSIVSAIKESEDSSSSYDKESKKEK